MPSQLTISFKALSQLGFEPLALNALYKFGLWTGHYKRIEGTKAEKLQSSPTLTPLFSLPSRKELLQILGKEGKAVLLKEADEIVAG